MLVDVIRAVLKKTLIGIWIVLLFPFALFTAFGRWKPIFTMFSHTLALAPGILGDYARAAYYSMTLHHCSTETRIMFGTFFAHPEATVARKVTIGAYCVLGRARIGEGTLIASQVQILSGAAQHSRDGQQQLGDGKFTDVQIGAGCWIGASAIIMANVGAGATVAAGAVVFHPVLPGATVAGNPARMVRMASAAIRP
jgi:acetyltransferase-like isoleucine patch superfamily enzyme